MRMRIANLRQNSSSTGFNFLRQQRRHASSSRVLLNEANQNHQSSLPSPQADNEQSQVDELRAALEEKLSGSDRLFADALKEEQAEQQSEGRKTGFRPDPNDPVWTGDERVQDTVLRMLMDKHKPLRVKGSSGTATDPVGEKLKSIQQPTQPASPTPTPPESPSFDGRRLPKTADNKPWSAKYVRPSHASGEAAIHYGKYLESTSTSSSLSFRSPKSSQTPAQRLKAAGVSVSQLPFDDPKAMRQLREGIKRFEKAGKLERAREGVLDYKLTGGNRSSYEGDPSSSGDGKNENRTTTGRQMPGGSLLLGGPQRWGSIVDERIREAQEAGFFKENKLRGKPLQRDINESNPYLKREEFFMNRMVKRQGAAPPWVELNMELERELTSFRSNLQSSWIRRATRMITSDSCHGLEPLPPIPQTGPNSTLASELLDDPDSSAADESGLISPSAGAEAKLVREIPAARTTGEQKLIDLVTSYRDPEWVANERAFHSLEVEGLNNKLRKYNAVAPYHVRRGYLMRERELEETFTRSLPDLIDEISKALRARGKASGLQTRSDSGLRSSSRNRIFNFWGQEVGNENQSRFVDDKGTRDGFTSTSVGEGSEDREGENSSIQHHRKSRSQTSATGVGFIRRTVDWARSRVGV